MMTDDPFAAYAQAEARKPAQRVDGVRVLTSENQAPMKPSAAEQAQRDASAQFARYKKSKRAEHEALLESFHANHYRVLLDQLKRLPHSANQVLQHLRAGWIGRLDAQQRMTVLSMIDARIIRVREMDGRPPIDDPLPGEPDNLFLLCRKEIMGA